MIKEPFPADVSIAAASKSHKTEAEDRILGCGWSWLGQCLGWSILSLELSCEAIWALPSAVCVLSGFFSLPWSVLVGVGRLESKQR